MKQATEAELKALLVMVYNEGFENGQYSANNAASLDNLDEESRDDYIEHVIADL